MKNIFLLAGVLIISVTILQAQNDTTYRKTTPGKKTGDTLRLSPVSPPQATTPAQQPDQYLNEDRVLIQPGELPVHVRETLQNNQFKGWENSSIYQDRVTGDYSIDINNGSPTPRSFRFDKNGKLIEDPNKSGQKTKGEN